MAAHRISAPKRFEGLVYEERRPDERLEQSDDVLPDATGLLPEPDQCSDESKSVDGAAAWRRPGRSLATLVRHITSLSDGSPPVRRPSCPEASPRISEAIRW